MPRWSTRRRTTQPRERRSRWAREGRAWQTPSARHKADDMTPCQAFAAWPQSEFGLLLCLTVTAITREQPACDNGHGERLGLAILFSSRNAGMVSLQRN